MKSLPSGTVTFCFTDIEGSTQLFAKLGPRFLDLLEEHRRIIRAAVEVHGGAEVKTEGDGFFLAFGDPSSAIACCVAFQCALADAEWPDGAPVKVRVGLHIGVAEPLEDDYMTYEVHEAARIGAVAHGGQTIVSDALRAVVASSVLEPVAFRDLGTHELKDLKPMRLHQVEHPELVVDFPPLRTVSGVRGYVPAPASSLVGRIDEIEAVRRNLGEARLVTITGAGGVGKTRLAVEAANRLLSTYPDGVWFIDLAPLTDPQRLDDAILDALGVVPEHDLDPRAQLLGFLSSREALLVIDNCEHLIDQVSAIVAALLASAPRARVLATSREALGIDGEHAWRLGSLDTESAEQLFVDRARTVESQVGATADDRASVSQIVARLDGIPLAIELAAARTQVLTPAQIAQRLDDRFRLLTGGTRTAVARQRTLEATVDWSYQLLDDDERILLRRLSVFAGGFDLEAAEAVGHGSALDVLGRLVDKSMVVASLHGDTIRYRLLETIRHFAWMKLLEADDVEAARDAHLEHFSRLAEVVADGLLDRREAKVAAMLNVEHDNIRAAIDWASASNDSGARLRLVAYLWMYWAVSGRVREGLDLTLAAIERADASSDADVRARAFGGAAHLTWISSGTNEDVRGFAARALNVPGRRPFEAPTWFDAWARYLSSIEGAAEEHDPVQLERAIEMSRLADAKFVLAHALASRALLHVSAEPAEAMANYDEAIATARACGSYSTLGEVLGRKATLVAHTGDIDEACDLSAEAVAAARRGPNVFFQMFALFGLNLSKTMRGDADAMEPIMEVLEIARDRGLQYQEMRALYEVGWDEIRNGAYENAIATFARGAEIATELGTRRPAVLLMAALASDGTAAAHQLAGRLADARDLLIANNELALAFGLQWPIALTHNSIGWLEQDAGDLDAAHASHAAAAEAVRDVPPGPNYFQAFEAHAASIKGLAGVAFHRGDLELATRLFAASSVAREPNLPAPRIGWLRGSELIVRTRAALGDQAFEALWTAGRADGLT